MDKNFEINKAALIKNVQAIKNHARQIKYIQDKESARQKLDRLFTRKEG